MHKFMSISPMNTAKKNTSLSTDQPVFMKTVLAIRSELTMDAKMSKLGNGPMPMIH